ncbi:MAG TPA: hypothetical protein VIG72_13085, partial [Pontibacter sp.]
GHAPADQQVHQEEEQAEEARHDEDHDGRGDDLAPARPDDLGGFGADQARTNNHNYETIASATAILAVSPRPVSVLPTIKL